MTRLALRFGCGTLLVFTAATVVLALWKAIWWAWS